VVLEDAREEEKKEVRDVAEKCLVGYGVFLFCHVPILFFYFFNT